MTEATESSKRKSLAERGVIRKRRNQRNRRRNKKGLGSPGRVCTSRYEIGAGKEGGFCGGKKGGRLGRKGRRG